MSRSLRSLAAALALTAALASCGSDAASPPGVAPGDGGESSDGGEAAAAEPNGETVEVLAVDNSFNEKEVTVDAGTEIVWENRGRNEHNIIPEDPDADWKVDTEAFQPGDTASHVFLEPGTYRYYCSIHGTIDRGMPGVIVVQ